MKPRLNGTKQELPKWNGIKQRLHKTQDRDETVQKCSGQTEKRDETREERRDDFALTS